MSKRIWKYEVPMEERSAILMPKGAKVLSVQTQFVEPELRSPDIHGRLLRPFLWAAVNPDAPIINFYFRIVGTGHTIPDEPLKYIATFQTPPFVWHLFQEKKS